MVAKIRLDKYVQPKINRGRRYYYFRVVKSGHEFRRPLPHPFDDGYRHAYNAAHAECFGNPPLDPISLTGFESMIAKHKAHGRYLGLSKDSKTLRDLASKLLLEKFSAFEPTAIKPIHMQALYDTLSDRPATANRRLDDMSAIFSWGRSRGFCDINPCTGIERISAGDGYEPWPSWALEKLFRQGKLQITQAALVALYTGQRRGDCLTQLRPSQIANGVWSVRQGKTDTVVPVPLHPVVLAIVDLHNESTRAVCVNDPAIPVLKTSRGTPWKSGFGSSWSKELVRLKLDTVEPRLTFHGLRTTNATMVASAVAQSQTLYGGIERVKSMLGHLSERMALHYARRAITERSNAESVLLLPDFGNQL